MQTTRARSICAVAYLGAIALVLTSEAARALPPPPERVLELDLEDDPFVQAGYLPVTFYDGWQGNAVDPTGTVDSTAAINRAILDGRESGLVTYLPPGTYLVSDTLWGEQNYQMWGCADHFGHPSPDYGTGFVMRKAPALVGPSSGPRPVIRLADHSAGFDDPTHPKPVIYMFGNGPGYGYEPSWWGQFDCGMNLHVRNLEVVLGSGNSGAVGIQIPSAQDSALQDVRVDARGGFAGIRGTTHTRASVNLEVVGGRYGIIMALGAESLVGVTLRDQEVAALLIDAYSPITITGFSIEKAQGPAIVVGGPFWGNLAQSNQLTLLDGRIRLAGGTSPAIANEVGASSGASLYLRNVYVQTPSTLVQSGSSPAVARTAGAWSHVREYVLTDLRTGHADTRAQTIVDGDDLGAGRASIVAADTAPTDLVTRHRRAPLPWFTDADVKNVKDADIGARGDGRTDDTAALQYAIDHHRTVFLPRGDYRISDTLVLRRDTRFVGVQGAKSRLVAPGWSPGRFAPMVRTDDDAGATTLLSDVWFLVPSSTYDQTYISALEWRAGRGSVVSEVYAETEWVQDTSARARSLVRVTGSGGGRWYGLVGWFYYDGRTNNPDARALLVDGTSEPLTFYAVNSEYTHSPMVEIRNASNVRMLGNKTEVKEPYLILSNSDNVLHVGIAGHCQFEFGVVCTQSSPGDLEAIIVDGASNYALVNETFYAGSHELLRMVTDRAGGGVAGRSNVVLYQRGVLDDSRFPHCGDGQCDASSAEATGCPADCTGSPPPTSGPTLPEVCRASSKPVIDGAGTDWTNVVLPDLIVARAVVAPGLTAAATVTSPQDSSARFSLAWDDAALYVLVDVSDDQVRADSLGVWDDDSVELYLDGMGEGASAYDGNDWQLTVASDGRKGGVRTPPPQLLAAASASGSGYRVEYAVPWSMLGGGGAIGRELGFDLAVNDDDDGGERDAQLVWVGDGTGYLDPRVFGRVVLGASTCGPEPTQPNANGPDVTQGQQDTQPEEGSPASIRGAVGCRAAGADDVLTLVLVALLAIATTGRRTRGARH